MPLVHHFATRKGTLAFQDGLAHLASLQRIPEDVELHPHPLPVYHLDVRDVMHGPKLQNAKHVAWRYFAGANSDPSAFGDVDLSGKPKATHLCYGSKPAEYLRQLENLTHDRDLAADLHEPRLLRIPSLLVEAFWLPSLSTPGDDDAGYLVPFHTMMKDVAADKPCKIKDFFEKLSPLALETVTGTMRQVTEAAYA